MELHTWLLFTLGTGLICATPGPNMLHMMVMGASLGLRYTLPSMLGCFIAVFILIGASVAGVGVLLQIFPNLFDALRYAGAAYIAYLGFQSMRAPVADRTAEPLENAAPAWSRFKKAFLIGISNPKAMLFASAYFPQFLNPEAPQAVQLFVLLATFGVLEFACYLAYAAGGSSLSVALRRASVQKIFNRATGALFMMFGAAMALKRT
ncbi:MAG: LysE family translocator [Alphaproteobacteria bacterium]|nr:LysE family translocator [Alphaproteobacteria bacterium]